MLENYNLHYENNNFIVNRELLNKNSRVVFSGKNNILIIATKNITKPINVDFRSDNSIVYLDSSKAILKILMGHGSIVYIGNDSSCTNATHLTAAEGKNIYIGPECMIAEDVFISNTDGHPIFDASGCRINYGKDIIIGEHVWIGRNAEILKGSEIGSGSIVAARSVVNKKFPQNVILAGAPAQVIKNSVSFERVTTVRKPLISSGNENLRVYPNDHFGSVSDLDKVKLFAKKIFESTIL